MNIIWLLTRLMYCFRLVQCLTCIRVPTALPCDPIGLGSLGRAAIPTIVAAVAIAIAPVVVGCCPGCGDALA